MKNVYQVSLLNSKATPTSTKELFVVSDNYPNVISFIKSKHEYLDYSIQSIVKINSNDAEVILI